MQQSKDESAADIRHEHAIAHVVAAVKRAVAPLLAAAGVRMSGGWSGGSNYTRDVSYTRDVASDLTRANLMHPLIARTSAINTIKAHAIEISRPAVLRFFASTCPRNAFR